MPLALAVRGLEKRYGSVTALGGVELEVAEGELVGLLGPNGAGKSTLVKIACGLVRQSAGSASICGEPAGSPPARAALGYLAELFRFPGWQRAEEVVALARVALARLDLLDESVEVLLGGGVLQEAAGALLAAIDSALHEVTPNVTVRPTASAAIVGAALLGLDEIEAPDRT